MSATAIRVVMYTPFTGPPFQALDQAAGDNSVANRINNLTNKIGHAYQRADSGQSTLKIFMAPEWYFRKSNQPYREDERDLVIKNLVRYNKEHCPDMLLIPGSIYWGVQNGNNWQVFNCSPIIHGGKLLSIHYKTYNCDIWDYGRNTWTTKPDFHEQWAMEDPEVAKKYHKKSNGLFKCEGRKFGYEICRDNSERVLQKAYIKEKSSGAGVDVHLMISASTRPSPGKCIARDGGYVVQCEGNNSDDTKNKSVSAQIYKMERIGCVRDGLNGVGGAQATWAKSPTTDKREPVGTKTFYWEDQRDHRIVIYDPLYF